ncbi:DUF1661 domain-containing protein [Porphyromonas gulae]|uniref:DUF1661 domain-containing protein n=1 Tax=Porphyromonas gulae TaxID=111105 RepID=UPI0034E980C4
MAPEVNFLRAKTKTFRRVFSRKDEPQFVHFRFRKTFFITKFGYFCCQYQIKTQIVKKQKESL